MKLCALFAVSYALVLAVVWKASQTPHSPSPEYLGSNRHGNGDGATSPNTFVENSAGAMEAATSEHHAERAGRRTFELATPFDATNAECKSQCYDSTNKAAGGFESSSTLAPFLNPCPACFLADEYCGQQCRSCCHGGASSLKLAWRACPGTLSFASQNDFEQDCGLGLQSKLRPAMVDQKGGHDGARFIPCDCYDKLIQRRIRKQGDEDDPITICTLSSTHEIPDDDCSRHEICIVSVAKRETVESNDCRNETNDWIIDLTIPLPSIVGLVMEPPSRPSTGDGSVSQTSSRIPTYVDTSCSGMLPNPVFPGYGKFLDSCPNMAFIDLQLAGKPPLPNRIDHFKGDPPGEMFWIEFLDGTSTGFWPTTEIIDTNLFLDPTFAVCGCQECAGKSTLPPLNKSRSSAPQPLTAPSTGPSHNQNAPPRASDRPSSQPFSSEPSARCAEFASANCRLLPTEPGITAPCVFAPDIIAQTVAKYLHDGDEIRSLSVVLGWFETNQISKEWLVAEMHRNQELIERLDPSKTPGAM